jgi:hypothetical protein
VRFTLARRHEARMLGADMTARRSEVAKGTGRSLWLLYASD